MRYLSFSISNYRAIESPLTLDLSKTSLIPLVGLNECGKTTILQAIYAFDFLNDSENQGKHLTDTKNLYQTSEKGEPEITAKIELKYTEMRVALEKVIEAHNSSINAEIKKIQEDAKLSDSLEDDEDTEIDEDEKEAKDKISFLRSKVIPDSFKFDKSTFKGHITLVRNLNLRTYSIVDFPDLPEHISHDAFARQIIYLTPYILYNDDFMDRPLNSIKIPDVEPPSTSGWLAIFDRLFVAASDGYSIFSIVKETDPRRRDAILSDVQEHLDKTLSKAWKQFSLSANNNIAINLKIAPNNEKGFSNLLEIKIVEKIGNKDRFFDVIDRSKGFLWFYNFVMKLEFNPKVTDGSEKHTVYLLDEPGSYLHYSAQEKLCSKLFDIADKYGTVIYCTHSHTLLNPEIIPLNNICIVEKDKAKKIKAIPLAMYQTRTENNSAFQPIYEALQISAFQYEAGKSKTIAVEGIYDKYAIELMLEMQGVSILPGTGANSIIKNIQFLNAYGKTYVAIWDNDEEGRKQSASARKFFGEFESERFDLLPLIGKSKRRMEEMFEPFDLAMIRSELKLDESSKYETVISNLYFSSKKVKNSIRTKISDETKSMFKILEEIISKRFAVSEKQKSMMT